MHCQSEHRLVQHELKYTHATKYNYSTFTSLYALYVPFWVNLKLQKEIQITAIAKDLRNGRLRQKWYEPPILGVFKNPPRSCYRNHLNRPTKLNQNWGRVSIPVGIHYYQRISTKRRWSRMHALTMIVSDYHALYKAWPDIGLAWSWMAMYCMYIETMHHVHAWKSDFTLYM